MGQFNPVRPDAIYVRRPWVSPETVAWMHACDQVMRERGEVTDQRTYPSRSQARNKARRLINLMIDFGVHSRPNLVEHTERRGERWGWSVRYIGPKR